MRTFGTVRVEATQDALFRKWSFILQRGYRVHTRKSASQGVRDPSAESNLFHFF